MKLPALAAVITTKATKLTANRGNSRASSGCFPASMRNTRMTTPSPKAIDAEDPIKIPIKTVNGRISCPPVYTCYRAQACLALGGLLQEAT